eukprot:gene13114-biopygen17663
MAQCRVAAAPPLPRYAFRALRVNEDPALGLQPKNLTSQASPEEHVTGSCATQFISLTLRPEMALYYARCRGARVQRVVRVDLRALRRSRLVDLRDEAGCDAAGLGPAGKCRTAGDQEVLHRGEVPAAVVDAPHPTMMRCETLAVDWGGPRPRRPTKCEASQIALSRSVSTDSLASSLESPSMPPAPTRPPTPLAPAPPPPRKRRRGGWRERCQRRGGMAPPFADAPALLWWNARGVRAAPTVRAGAPGAPPVRGEPDHKLAELLQVMGEELPAYAGIGETHLDASTLDGALYAQRYRIAGRADRDRAASRKSKNGGVLVYAREDRDVRDVVCASKRDFEAVALTDGASGIRLIVCYRAGAANLTELTDWLDEQFQRAGKNPCMVVGDLNMDMRKKHPHPRVLRQLLSAQPHLVQRVGFNTRFEPDPQIHAERSKSHQGSRILKATSKWSARQWLLCFQRKRLLPPVLVRQVLGWTGDLGKSPRVGSLIDHVWSPFPCRCSPVRALEAGCLSDHRAIRVHHAKIARRPPCKRVRTRIVRPWRAAAAEDIAHVIRRHFTPLRQEAERRRPPHSPVARVPKRAPTAEDVRAEMRAQGVGTSGIAPESDAEAAEWRSAHHAATGILRSAPLEAGAALRAWNAAWTEILTCIVPAQRRRVAEHKTKLTWLSAATRQQMRQRNRLRRARDRAARRAAQSDAADNDLSAALAADGAYQHAKRAAVQAFRDEQRASIKTEWQRRGPRMNAQRWQVFNWWRGRLTEERPEPPCTAERINKAFLQKVAGIRLPLQLVQRPEVVHRAVPHPLMHFEEVSAAEIHTAIQEARATTSSGTDEVPMSQLRRVAPLIIPELTMLLDAVVRGETWPTAWKDADVMPLWKRKGCKSDPHRYRPVALLRAIARLAERIVLNRLDEHVNRNRIMPDCQHGFRTGHSCSSAISAIVQAIAQARDEGHVAVVCSLDAACAFDTPPHERMLQRLERQCGIRGSPLALLRSYLTDRRQRVRKQDGSTSAWADIVSGVPQGAVLSPLLYALYTLDVSDAVRSAEVVQFADDITLIARGRTRDEACSAMNEALAQYHSWATENGIAPEPEKTQLMISAAAAKLQARHTVGVLMNGTHIEPAETIRILGVLLDEQLTWEAHAADAARRAHNAIHAVHRTARHLPTRDRGDLMAALALPYLDYCQVPMVLPSAAATATFKKAYNRAARVAARQWRWRPGLPEERWRTAPALARLHRWTTWERRRAADRAAAVCKLWHRRQPQSLCRWLPDSPTDPPRGRVPGLRQVIHPRTVFGGNMFASWAPRIATQVLRGTVLNGLPGVDRPQRPRTDKPHAAPPDEWATQRQAYHREVTAWRGQAFSTQSVIHATRPRAWFARPMCAEYRPNADLWRQVDAILNTRGDNVRTAWVRGHARVEATRAGEASDLLVM